MRYIDTNRVQGLVNAITSQFSARTETEGRKSGIDYGINLTSGIDASNILWLTFAKGEEKHSITIPLPFMENGVQMLQQNEVLRAVCPFWLEKDQRELDYLAAMYYIVLDTPEGIVSHELVKATPYLQRMIYGFKNGNASVIAYRFQQAINEVVNRMPLHETWLNSYVMNQRLMIVDTAFEELRSPAERLNYQVEKAKKYFDRGWTAMGLSDGTLADKNYLLKVDLRRLSPFGLRYHNPQRNLYSTLGMKGDEEPLIRSQSSRDLADVGITRKGWNWFTAFVDIPDIFEDQIMVDKRHAGKVVTYERRYQVFGTLRVKEGQAIKTNELLGVSPDQEHVLFDTVCDSARVTRIVETTVSVGGNEVPAFNIVISYRRKFRDGVKITNMHGNKGVIRMADLGHAVDPRTGEVRKLDVIVGAKTVGKRRNYGQILEAMTTCIMEADVAKNPVNRFRTAKGMEPVTEIRPIVIEDEWYQPLDQIEAGLERRGFRRDGTWDCDTYVGKVSAVCGNVFWGVIKTPEDQVWKPKATINRNGKEVRTAGLKLSHVEFRAIETRFGAKSAIMDEIMSYAQGTENLHELLDMVRAKTGVVPTDKPIRPSLKYNEVKPMDQNVGTIVPGQYIGGTVVDEFFMPDGFILQLPLPYMTLVEKNGETCEGSPLMYDQLSPQDKAKYVKSYTTDRLYIPSGTLRKCWRHDTGRYGLSEIGVLVNNVVVMCHRLMADYNNPVHHRLYYSSLFAFFLKLSNMLGSKRGEISTYGMAVRYPFSAKAVATLSTTLPKNTVEIHRDMARVLRVNNGDVVLAERFPCLGFMSVRPQKVRITDDPMAKYVIRVSGNSLVSQNLDFDGDVLFLAAFHTPAARMELLREWTNPNQTCYKYIQRLNERKGAPHIKEYNLQAFDIRPFADLTNEEHAAIIEKNTGVKAQTGPVIALTYNIMRIVENSDLAKDQKMKVAVEMFLEKAAQSVFEQKHGGKSLYEIVIDGVCTADVEMLVDVGFKRGTTEKLCALIRERAGAIGVFDLVEHHRKFKEGLGSNIISRIVRQQNRIYFASRARLEGTQLIEVLDEPAVDIPSRMFKWVMSGKAAKASTILDKVLDEDMAAQIKNPDLQEAAVVLCNAFDGCIINKPSRLDVLSASMLEVMARSVKGGHGYASVHNHFRRNLYDRRRFAIKRKCS